MQIKQRLQDILFSRFTDFLVNRDLTVFQNYEAEINLPLQFYDLTRSARTSQIVDMQSRILGLSKKLDETGIMISVLEERYDSFICEILKTKLGYPFQFTEESYLADIAKIRAQSISSKMKIDDYEKHIIKISSDTKTEEPTYEGYAATTLEISKELGYSLPKDIDTLAWAVAYKQMIQNREKAIKDAGRKSR